MKNTCKLKKPCGTCPFNRKVTPGTLGGSPTTMYLGQIHRPFWLPCHNTVDFEDSEWKSDTYSAQQCAGAAIFRANIGVEGLMPPQLHGLGSDHENVFSTSAEFLSHHEETSIEHAKFVLTQMPVQKLMYDEMKKAEAKILDLTT
jgi:hypothetical protein